MSRKFLVIAIAAVVGAGAAGLVVLTQQQGLEIQEVADGLYMIVGNGGNVGVRVTSEGVVVVGPINLSKTTTTSSQEFGASRISL